jgi:hypothetical protein
MSLGRVVRTTREPTLDADSVIGLNPGAADLPEPGRPSFGGVWSLASVGQG